jgi:hypothetical protein
VRMRETLRGSPSGVYPQLLGPGWGQLAESVRRLHGEGTIIRAAGTFRVWHGSNLLTRLLARLTRLPATGKAVEMRLTVTRLKHGEEWRRTFAGRPVVSRQWQRPDGLLAERLGPVEIRFRLAVMGGALNYQTRNVTLCLGPLRIPLPHRLAPRVTAWEKPTADRDRIDVAVETRLPLFGLLLAYKGTVTRAETQTC